MEDKKILVFYIGVGVINNQDDIEDYVKRVTSKITPRTFNGEIIVIPTNSVDTRIECINPKYITSEELINEHNNLINELNSELSHQVNLLKNEYGQ